MLPVTSKWIIDVQGLEDKNYCRHAKTSQGTKVVACIFYGKPSSILMNDVDFVVEAGVTSVSVFDGKLYSCASWGYECYTALRFYGLLPGYSRFI